MAATQTAAEVQAEAEQSKSPQVQRVTTTKGYTTIPVPDKFKVNNTKLDNLETDITLRRIELSNNADTLHDRFNEVLDSADLNRAFNNVLLINVEGRNRLQFPQVGIQFTSDPDHEVIIKRMLPLINVALSKGFDQAFLKADQTLRNAGDANKNIHIFNIAIRSPEFQKYEDLIRKTKLKIDGCQEQIDRPENVAKLDKIEEARNEILKIKEKIADVEKRFEALPQSAKDEKLEKAAHVLGLIDIKLKILDQSEKINAADPQKLTEISTRRMGLFQRMVQIQKAQRGYLRAESKEEADLKKEKKTYEKELREAERNLSQARFDYKEATKTPLAQRAALRRELRAHELHKDEMIDKYIEMTLNDMEFRKGFVSTLMKSAEQELMSAVTADYGKTVSVRIKNRNLTGKAE